MKHLKAIRKNPWKIVAFVLFVSLLAVFLFYYGNFIAGSGSLPKVIKRSVGQGDFVRDERSPAEACNSLMEYIRKSNPGLQCSLTESKRIDANQNLLECVNGASIAGCFACTFECR